MIFFLTDFQLFQHLWLKRKLFLPLNNFCTFVKNQLGIFVCSCFWDCGSILINMSIPLPITHHLNYCAYIICLSIRWSSSSQFLLLQNCFRNSWSCVLQYKFQSKLIYKEVTDQTMKYLLVGVILNRSIWRQLTFSPYWVF